MDISLKTPAYFSRTCTIGAALAVLQCGLWATAAAQEISPRIEPETIRCGALTLPRFPEWHEERSETGITLGDVSRDYLLNYLSIDHPAAWISVYEIYLPATSDEPATSPEPSVATVSAGETSEDAGSWAAVIEQQKSQTVADDEGDIVETPPFEPRPGIDPLLDADIWRRGGKIIGRLQENPRPPGTDPRPANGEVVVRGETVFYQVPLLQKLFIDAPSAAEEGAPNFYGSRERVPVVIKPIYMQGLVIIAEGLREYHIHYNIPATDIASRQVMHRLLRDVNLRGDYPTREYADLLFEDQVPLFIENQGITEDVEQVQASLDEASPEDGMTRSFLPAQTASELAAGTRSSEELANLHRESLAIIDGQHSSGSAFLCNWGEESYIVSNIHVVAADQTGRATTLYGAPLPIEEAWAAVGHDIMRFKARPSGKITLEVIEDFDTTVKIGDPIAVIGNSEGAGVVQPLFGRIVGLGPDRVEVDAEFVPGNSGSPIVHLPTGKVIAIATYIQIRDRTFIDRQGRDEDEQEFRRFGYRLDSVQTWQPVNWGVFFAQAAQISSAEQLSVDIIMLLRDLGDGDGVNVYQHRNPAIKDAVRSYIERISENPRMSRSDRQKLAVRFISNLKTASTSDLAPLKNQRLYDYFDSILTQEEQLRALLVDDFDSWLQLHLR